MKPEELASEVAKQVEAGELAVTFSKGDKSVTLGGKKGRKEKPEKYELLAEDDPSWAILAKVREEHHQSIEDAEITLVYENNIRPDRDGHVVMGRAKKTGPLERKFRPHDFKAVEADKLARAYAS